MPFTYICSGCGTQTIKRIRKKNPDDRVFCTPECYHASQRKSPFGQICEYCGKRFDRRVTIDGKIRKGSRAKRRFCSQQCCYNSKLNPVTKVCVGCEKEFTIAKGAIAHRYNYCSFACKTAQTKYYDCERCGKRFRGEQKRYKSHFCSEECRRPPTVIECENCGAEFRICPGDINRRFCCFACYRAFTGETTLEKKVRLTLEDLGVRYKQEADFGRWSVDFHLLALGIALEADGTYWHSLGRDSDKRKDAHLVSEGLRVIRLNENEVNLAESEERLTPWMAGQLGIAV